MKVGKAIEALQEFYSPDDELFIAWWDKETVEVWVREMPITEGQWAWITEQAEDSENLFDAVYRLLVELSEQAREN